MKNTCIIFLLMPLLCIGQNLDFLPATGSLGLDLVHIANTDNGMRVFTGEATTCNKLSANQAEDTRFNQFHVMDYDENGKVINKETYILYKSSFPSGDYSFKKGRTTYGTNEDVITYDKLVSIYPSLAEVDYIDSENRKYPQEFYKTKLMKSFLFRIEGFKSTKYLKKPESPEKKEKKEGGLIKVTGLNLNSLLSKDVYEKADTKEHDWKDSYKDGQKKSYWLSQNDDAACQSTGKIITYQAYKSDDDDTNLFKQKEIVVFDKDGSVLKTTNRSSEKQWKIVGQAKNTKFENGLGTLSSISFAEKEAYHKKKNPNANRNTIRIQNIKSDGDVAYEHLVELPFPIGVFDTLILADNGTSLFYGSTKKGPYFVSSCKEDKCTTTLLGNEDKYYGDLCDLISTKEGDYAIFLRGNKFNVFPLAEGPVEAQTIKTQSSEPLKIGFDYSETGQGLIFAFKDSTKGINDFRWEMTNIQLMKVDGTTLTPISNFENDQFVLDKNRAQIRSKFLELNGDIYISGKVFKEDKEGELRVYNTIAKFKM